MNGAVVAVGTIVRRGNGDGPPETFSDIPGVVSVNTPLARESAAIKTTDMKVLVDNQGRETYVGNGVINQPTFTVHIQYQPGNAVQELVRGDVGTTRNYQVAIPVSPGPRLVTGACVVVGFKPGEMNIQGLYEADIEFQPSGLWTET